jgi:selenocysteine lyase/cysteine desulfurase
MTLDQERSAMTSLVDRADFPVLDELTYLNTASIGLVPLSVQREAQKIEADIATRGTTWFDEVVETEVLERARSAAAQLFNAPRDQIAVTSSATEALSQVAWNLRPEQGSNIVSTNIEFPSVTYPWFRVAAETGAEVRLADHVGDLGGFSFDTLAEKVDQHTSVIAVSLVQYSTGINLSLPDLSSLAREHGAALVVDATQAAGHVPIDVGSSDVHVDALVCGGYKWLCGPFGAAVCFIGESLLQRLDPPFVGWRSAPDPYSMDAGRLNLAPTARRLEFSTMSYSAAVALGAAIEFVLNIGVDRILQHNRALADRLSDGLASRGANVLTPRLDGSYGGIVTVRFPEHDGASLAARLNEARIIVSPRAGSVRFSAHFFNDGDDVERALATLDDILAGKRERSPSV